MGEGVAGLVPTDEQRGIRWRMLKPFPQLAYRGDVPKL